jgi:hypothetical protein
MAHEPISDRSRSPRAPKHSLQQAVTYAKMIYDAVHRSSVSSMLAYELMGFGGKSGASATALGSVRQFGLIEGTGDKTRISDLALMIFEPASNDEQIDAFIDASKRPEIFHDIRNRFNDRLPGTDEPIRAYLIRERSFLKSGADETIRSLRETEQFVVQAMAGRSAAHVGPQLGEEQPTSLAIIETSQTVQNARQAEMRTLSSDAAHSHLVRVALTKDCMAELRFEGEITERAVFNLLKYVDLMREVWAETDDGGE